MRLTTNGEDTGYQPGRGGKVVGRGFAREGREGGRGSNIKCNCFNCGKEGHFTTAYPNKSNPAKEAAELEVNLISSSKNPVLGVTRSTSQRMW